MVENSQIAATPSQSQQRWRYDRTQIGDVRVWGEISIFKFDGRIAVFQDHPVYGDGFHGDIGLDNKKGYR